jgi:hypothetical protein
MLRAGIVGLPNVGKSTLFNAVTRTRKAEAANYPFCTIDPNVGIVTVPDARLEPLSKIAKTQVLIPAAVASHRGWCGSVDIRVPIPERHQQCERLHARRVEPSTHSVKGHHDADL